MTQPIEVPPPAPSADETLDAKISAFKSSEVALASARDANAAAQSKAASAASFAEGTNAAEQSALADHGAKIDDLVSFLGSLK